MDEIREGIKEFYPDKDYTESTIQGIFKMLDKNQSGAIEFSEWCELLILLPKLNLKAMLHSWEVAVTISDPLDMYSTEI